MPRGAGSAAPMALPGDVDDLLAELAAGTLSGAVPRPGADEPAIEELLAAQAPSCVANQTSY